MTSVIPATVRRIALYTGLVLLTTIYAIPVIYMFWGSLKPDVEVLSGLFGGWDFWVAGLNFQNYRDVFARVDFLRYVVNSLIITLGVVMFGLLINSMAAYALARFDWWARGYLLGAILVILIVPLEAIAVPLFYQLSVFGLRDTYFVQIIPFIANAFFIYLFYTYFISLPKTLEEAAYIDGAGPIRTYFTIIVPNSKPVFAAVTILSFLLQWSNFLWPLLITSDERVRPLSLAISTFYTLPPLQWGDVFAFGVMMVLPILLVFLIFQQWFVQGVVASGYKG